MTGVHMEFSYDWFNIQTKTEFEFVLGSLKKIIKNNKIKRIFSHDVHAPRKLDNGIIYYSGLDEKLYLLFENNYCLVISFFGYSDIDIEYRKITEEEIKLSYKDNKEIDFLNGHYEIHSWKFDDNRQRIEGSFGLRKTIDINGEYNYIKDYRVSGFHKEFYKWVSNGETSDMILIPAGGDYFDKFTIILNNGIEITIAAEDAIVARRI